MNSTFAFMDLRVARKNKFRLSIRDRQVVQLVANGFTAKQIAEQGNVSYRTIEQILYSLREHYKCKTSSHLVATFIRKKLID